MSQEQSEQKNSHDESSEKEEEIQAVIERWKLVCDELETEAVKQRNRLSRFMIEAKRLEDPQGHNLRLVFDEIRQSADSIQILSYFSWHLLDFLSGQRELNEDLKHKMPERVGESFARTLAKIEAMRKASQDGNGDSETTSPAERLFKKKSDDHVQLS